MTDSSLNQGNGNSNGKRSAPPTNGAHNYHNPSKIVKFNENSRSSGKDPDGSTKKSGQTSHLTRQDYLIQRQALPIYPNRQKYREFIVNLISFYEFVAYFRLMVEVEKHPTLILIGETGSGKTTQIPQFIVEQGIAGNGMIAVTQVRQNNQVI